MNCGEPLPLYETEVAADWVDYNGHMNDAAYALVFSRSVDALMDRIGLDARCARRPAHAVHPAGDAALFPGRAKANLVRACHLLEHDDKRMRVWLEMKAGREGAIRRERTVADFRRSGRCRRSRAPRRGAPKPWRRSTRWRRRSAASKSRRWRDAASR